MFTIPFFFSMDYYKTLGVSKNASQDEIKKAYRKLASKHHPDRGGDTKKFQEIQVAYDVLSDDQKRAEYDNPSPQFGGFDGNGWRFTSGNPEDFENIFNQFGFFGQRPGARQRRNKNLNVRVTMTLEEILEGKTVIGSLTLPSGRDQPIDLKIPKGVKHGDVIKYSSLGDDSIPGIPRGDVIVTIEELAHYNFIRDGDNLRMEYNVSAFDAILGTVIRITSIDNTTLEIKVPAGSQPGTTLSCSDYGMPKYNSNQRGKLYIKLNVVIPKNISDEDKKLISNLKEKYGS